MKDKLGDDVIRQTIISHATSLSDMLELAILLKEVGLVDTERARVQIVPLFETIEDLDHSEETMRKYLSLSLAKNGLTHEITTKKSCLATLTVIKMAVTCHHVGPSTRLNSN